ncbi:MAG: hypothetical protein ACFFCS_29420 [Candidatus Hodarchaeota archaeon]
MNKRANIEENKDANLSSYEKGINNLLNNTEMFEALIWAYVLRVNSNFYSKEFPSTQIAKIILSKLDIRKSKFPIFHKVIRIILNRWQDKGICTLVSNSSTSTSRKTKEIYRFNEDGINKMKAKFIDKCIEDIEKNGTLEKDSQVLRTRDKIIEDLYFQLHDLS